MKTRELLAKVKKIIIEELKAAGFVVEEIYLFGSRARGDASKDSDWDFYVIVDKDIDFTTKRLVNLKIRRKLVKLNIASDILIQSKKIIDERRNVKGYLNYYVFKEGIKL